MSKEEKKLVENEIAFVQSLLSSDAVTLDTIFPELKDTINDKNALAYRNNVEIPLQPMLLIYDHIFVPVYPTPDEKSFTHLHGIGTDDLIDLAEKKVITPVINLDIDTKATPPIEKLFSSSISTVSIQRFEAMVNIISQKQFDHFLKEGVQFCAGRFSKTIRKTPRWSLVAPYTYSAAPDMLEREAAYNYALLRSAGCDVILKAILSQQTSFGVYILLEIYAMMVAIPLLYGVITNVYDPVTIMSHRLDATIQEQFVFPSDIGNTIASQLTLSIPHILSYDDLVDVRVTAVSQNIREALGILLWNFKSGRYTGIRNAARIINNQWDELQECIPQEDTEKSLVFHNSFSLNTTGFTTNLSFLGFSGVIESLPITQRVESIPPQLSSHIYSLGALPFCQWNCKKSII